jgi:DNA-binding CsgD family transcriptional regulator
VVAIALIDRGDPTAASDTLANGRRFVRSDEDRSLLCVGQAELAWARGDRLALAAALDELASCSRGFFGMNAMSESAAIHTLLDDPGALDVPRIEASLMPVVDVVRVERTAFDEWRQGHGPTAIRTFGEAAREWDERGFARFAARCHLAAGRVAAHCRDREEAVRHLDLAAEMASRWGLVPIAAATRNVLAELECQRSRARLTGREIEVLDLVAGGRSTAQIAARLGVGASTVITHVNSARTKLGAQTRMQAASMVAAQDAK